MKNALVLEDRNCAMELIRDSAIRHGFEFVEDGFGSHIRDGHDWSKAWVNFTISDEDCDFDFIEECYYFSVVVTASPCRMGGNNTIKDLREAADHLSRAADLVEELSSITLVYKRYIKK